MSKTYEKLFPEIRGRKVDQDVRKAFTQPKNQGKYSTSDLVAEICYDTLDIHWFLIELTGF